MAGQRRTGHKGGGCLTLAVNTIRTTSDGGVGIPAYYKKRAGVFVSSVSLCVNKYVLYGGGKFHRAALTLRKSASILLVQLEETGMIVTSGFTVMGDTNFLE